jgi:hypothetical protein
MFKLNLLISREDLIAARDTETVFLAVDCLRHGAVVAHPFVALGTKDFVDRPAVAAGIVAFNTDLPSRL